MLITITPKQVLHYKFPLSIVSSEEILYPTSVIVLPKHKPLSFFFCLSPQRDDLNKHFFELQEDFTQADHRMNILLVPGALIFQPSSKHLGFRAMTQIYSL